MPSPPHQETYQDFSESVFATPFWEFYKVFWEAERRFDLPFRRDQGVALWAANRVRFYYELLGQLGLYEVRDPSPASPLGPDDPLPPLPFVDFFVQTGATGPATVNRMRPFGCTYTERFVRPMLDRGARVLLLHDAPQELARVPGLHALSRPQFNEHLRRLGTAQKVPPVKLEESAAAFWSGVAEFLRAELGVEFADPERLARLVRAHKVHLGRNLRFLGEIRPNAMICMAHYFRAPQIEAARSLGIRTIDYQHGINSRYHLGYGYPHVEPGKRDIPCFPDEFWSWGRIWANPAWFPHACCQVRQLGHQEAGRDRPPAPAFDSRPERTLLVTTSWAMQRHFRDLVATAAAARPDWTVRVKLHPAETASDYADLAEDHANVEIVPGDTDILTAAAEVRYVVSICSSSLFDVLLAGCRIAVLRAPSVEYAEDFVTRYGVPVLEPDCANLEAVIDAMKRQSIPVDEVFHEPVPVEWDLLWDSLAIPAATIRAPLPLQQEIPASASDAVLRKLGKLAFRRESATHDLLDPRPWRPVRRLLARSHRRFNKRHYAKTVRDSLLSLDGLGRRVSAFEGAVSAGLTPAYNVRIVRTLLPELRAAGDPGLLERLLRAIYSDPAPENARLQAELFEHWLSVSPDHGPSGDALPDRRWKAAAAILSELAPPTARLARHYTAIATAAAEEFADTRVSSRDRKALRSTLVDRLASGDPFTMMRLGDGEAYAFEPDFVPLETREADYLQRETLWWSQPLDKPLRARLRLEVQRAIPQADMLGVPSAFRLLRDMPRLLHLMRGPIDTWHHTARAHVVLFEELARLAREGRLDWTSKTLIDDRCHQELFAPEGIHDFLTPDRPRVLVNCFTREQVNHALGTAFFTHELRLPPHSKVRDHVPDDALARAATPHILDDLLAGVDRLAQDGAVFHVAGGFVGKILIGRVAENGATALDIGAAADYWMGLQTRGPLDFRGF